jgi:hypothetical protein
MIRTPSILLGLSTLEVGWLVDAMLPAAPEGAGRLAATHIFALRQSGVVDALEDAERAMNARQGRLGQSAEAFNRGFGERMASLDSTLPVEPAPKSEIRVAPPKAMVTEPSTSPKKTKARDPSLKPPL